MNRQDRQERLLKLIHFISTGWFAFSAGYMLVSALLRAGKSWWIIVPLSGYWALIVFLLISLYLFAIFRGVARSQKTEIEHPLTTSIYYLVFYDISPFLGALAGSLAAIGVRRITDYLLVITTGSLWTTFLMWIIVDPVTGLVEMLLPSSREHRRARLAEAKAMREKQRLAKERLLAEVEAKEQLQRGRWKKVLLPEAEKLAALVTGGGAANECRETEAVDIGVKAWQIGGLSCMQQLHSMAVEICRCECGHEKIIDYISIWWDGIGSWRSHWFEGAGEPILEEKGVLCGA